MTKYLLLGLIAVTSTIANASECKVGYTGETHGYDSPEIKVVWGEGSKNSRCYILSEIWKQAEIHCDEVTDANGKHQVRVGHVEDGCRELDPNEPKVIHTFPFKGCRVQFYSYNGRLSPFANDTPVISCEMQNNVTYPDRKVTN